MELDHELVESTEDGDLVLALNADVWLRKRSQAKTQLTQDTTEFKQHFKTKIHQKQAGLLRVHFRS